MTLEKKDGLDIGLSQECVYGGEGGRDACAEVRRLANVDHSENLGFMSHIRSARRVQQRILVEDIETTKSGDLKAGVS